MWITLVTLTSFVSVAALVAGLTPLITESRKARLESRLHELTVDQRETTVSNTIVKRGQLDGARLFSLIARGLGRRFENFVTLFDQPDSSITINVFLAMSATCGALGVVAATVGQFPRNYSAGAALASGSLPFWGLVARRRRRLKTFARQLPNALELLARAMRSGNSLATGLRCVADTMLPPVGVEFAMVCERLNLGVSLDRAFEDMLRRVPNRDLKFFVTALRMHRQTGGNLTEVLDNISHIVRERLAIMGQVKALTGEGRISGLVLMSLPLLVGGGVYCLNPSYVLLLVDHPLGRQMLEVAVLLQVIGAIAIHKIVNIKI